jgi:hypothetical protein
MTGSGHFRRIDTVCGGEVEIYNVTLLCARAFGNGANAETWPP